MSRTTLRWHLLVTFALGLSAPPWAHAQLATDNPYGQPTPAPAPAHTTPPATAPPATVAPADAGTSGGVEANQEPDEAQNTESGAEPANAPATEPAASTDAPQATESTGDEFAAVDAEEGHGEEAQVEEPVVAGAPPARSLVPDGEAELMDDHAVDLEHIRFRPGHGLEIESADGAFSITTQVRVQVLYQLDAPNASGEDPQQQLTLRRARIQFSGRFFGQNNRYKLQLAFSPGDVGIRDSDDGRAPRHTPLLDYYLEFRQLRDLQLRVGQFKVPFNRERLTSSGNLQMVGRSIVNEQFNLDRDLGIDVSSKDLFGLGYLRYHLGAYIARGREAVGFGNFHMMGLARVEYLPFGAFDDMSQVDFERSSDPHLAIGAAFGYVDHARNNRGIKGSRPADGGTTQTRHLALDAIFKLSGFSAIAEVLYRSGNRNPGNAVDDMGVPIPVEAPSTGYGITFQAGYLLPRAPFEVAARFATIRRIGSMTDSSLSEENEVGIGVNWYFAQHSFKLSADVVNRWNNSFGNDGDMLFELQLSGGL